jgi:hypothetical protein
MTRRKIFVIVVLGTLLLAAAGWWIAKNFAQLPVEHDEPPSAEARRNHYLALERFMERMGRPLKATGDVRILDRLEPGGVLILDRHHRAVMTKARMEEVFDWVQRGGYLIVVPESRDEPDPVLSYLHVKWDENIHSTCGCGKRPAVPATQAAPASAPAAAQPNDSQNDDAESDAPLFDNPQRTTPAAPTAKGASALLPASAPAKVASAPASAQAEDSAPDLQMGQSDTEPPASAPSSASTNKVGGKGAENDDSEDAEEDAPRQSTISASIPGSSKPLEIEMQYSGLDPGKSGPAWAVALEDNSDWLLNYRHGKGNVSVIVNLNYIVSNGAIADHDHAEFFWKLLEHYQPTGPVTLMTHLPMPDLFDWLVDTAWAASISGVALILLWLWSISPRFGGTVPDVPPSRRELREHLNAVGRFVWRNEGLTRWLEVARTSFRERLSIRHPVIAAMTYPDQAEALAKMASLPRETILDALIGRPGTASEFTAMLRTLKHLKHNL